ncbi:MAG: alpha/beta hydrolase [Candidatus Sulfopaludibacter sp.]|nr:alpha/beta hydrolase [Candidatus Sulfopaludibacter sp.]
MLFRDTRGTGRNQWLVAPVILLLPMGLLRGQTTNPLELIKQATPTASDRLAYGKNPLQVGELRLPTGTGPFPVAILVHGGCWEVKINKLPESVTSFELLRPIAAALATAGIASWNVEYRRLGNVGGGWPGTYQDLSRATDYLRELAPRYHLDLKRAVALGHSSGGQLAVWLGARGKLPKTSVLYANSPLPLNGVVSVDGPPDLEADRAIDQSACGGPVIAQFIGGTPAEFPDRYREGSASGLLPTGTRQEIFVSNTFGEKWTAVFQQYVAAAEKAGDPVRLLTMDGAGHFDGIDPQARAWRAVLASIQTLAGAP